MLLETACGYLPETVAVHPHTEIGTIPARVHPEKICPKRKKKEKYWYRKTLRLEKKDRYLQFDFIKESAR